MEREEHAERSSEVRAGNGPVAGRGGMKAGDDNEDEVEEEDGMGSAVDAADPADDEDAEDDEDAAADAR